MRDFKPLAGLNLNLLVYCLDSGVHHILHMKVEQRHLAHFDNGTHKFDDSVLVKNQYRVE